MYYRFLDKFHVEPKDWLDLFEYTNYIEVDGKINKIISDSSKEQ